MLRLFFTVAGLYTVDTPPSEAAIWKDNFKMACENLATLNIAPILHRIWEQNLFVQKQPL